MARDAIPAYFKWRSGRPRWEPGPSLRARGIRGRSLKNAKGAWLDEQEAIEAAAAINRSLSDNPHGFEVGKSRRPAIIPSYFRTESAPIPEYRNLLAEIWEHNRIRNNGRGPLPVRGSFVYIFTLEKRWAKIGVSSNVRHRHQTLSTGLPIELEAVLVAPGNRQHERELHDAFAEFRLRGEWFRIAGGFASWVNGIAPENTPKSDGKSEVG